jgi:hypothetical protein
MSPAQNAHVQKATKGRDEVFLSYNMTAHSKCSFTVDSFPINLQILKFIFPKMGSQRLYVAALFQEKLRLILYSRPLCLQKYAEMLIEEWNAECEI